MHFNEFSLGHMYIREWSIMNQSSSTIRIYENLYLVQNENVKVDALPSLKCLHGLLHWLGEKQIFKEYYEEIERSIQAEGPNNDTNGASRKEWEVQHKYFKKCWEQAVWQI